MMQSTSTPQRNGVSFFAFLAILTSFVMAVSCDNAPRQDAASEAPSPVRERFSTNIDTLVLTITLSSGVDQNNEQSSRSALRSVTLHVPTLRSEPVAVSPTGEPISSIVRISKEEGSQLLAVLDRRRLLTTATEILPSWSGDGIVISVSVLEGDTLHQQFITIEDVQQARDHLVAIRDAIDRKARLEIDKLRSSL